MLTREVVAGQPLAGDFLPRETDLAERFEVSRGVARECIRALEERGLVRVRHGRGAIVNPRERWELLDPDVLVAVLDGPLAPELLSEILECRRILEVETAALGAERASDQAISQLAAALGDIKHATARPRAKDAEDRFHKADVLFHEAIVDATGNQALGSLARRIHDALLAARYPLARPQYRAQGAIPEHEAIHAAIAAHDPAAARAAITTHLATIESHLRKHARRVAAA